MGVVTNLDEKNGEHRAHSNDYEDPKNNLQILF
jgi:hypothetical protein